MSGKAVLASTLIFLSFIGNSVFASSVSTNNPSSTQSSIPTGGSPKAINGKSSDVTSTDFEIDTSLFSVGGNSLKGSDSKETMKNALGNTIKKLMIALGVVSLFVMVIGTGYMILYRGHDEYLSKGKNIFIGGITALVVALCSYYLVNLIGYILYN